MKIKKRTARITEADFFSGIFTVLALDDYEILLHNQRFEEDVVKIFEAFKIYAGQNGFELPFRIRLHPFHKDSETIHNGILSAMQRGIITLDSPRNEKIRIKLTKDEATAILDDMPGGKLFVSFAKRIIEIFSH